MGPELQKLASDYIKQVEENSGILSTTDKERIKYLVELSALHGVIEYQKKQIGAAVK